MKLTPEVKTHGGKTYLCEKIFEHAPQRYTKFADLFMGGGSMTYNAPLGLQRQIANDKNYFRWLSKTLLKDHCSSLIEALKPYHYREIDFERAKLITKSAPTYSHFYKEECVVAAAWIVKSRMSRGGLGVDFAWSDRQRGGQPGDVNAWEQMIERLPLLSERLQNVLIFNTTAQAHLEDLEVNDCGEWFIYLDPPYMSGTRSTTATEYGEDEMSDAEHIALVEQVRNLKSQIAISHYRCDLYDSLGWRTVEFKVPNHSGQGETKQRRTEVLYMNYVARSEPRWMSRLKETSR